MCNILTVFFVHIHAFICVMLNFVWPLFWTLILIVYAGFLATPFILFVELTCIFHAHLSFTHSTHYLSMTSSSRKGGSVAEWPCLALIHTYTHTTLHALTHCTCLLLCFVFHCFYKHTHVYKLKPSCRVIIGCLVWLWLLHLCYVLYPTVTPVLRGLCVHRRLWFCFKKCFCLSPRVFHYFILSFLLFLILKIPSLWYSFFRFSKILSL